MLGRVIEPNSGTDGKMRATRPQSVPLRKIWISIPQSP